MEIRIGFSYRNMLFSRFLRWTERRPFSHCYVRVVHPLTRQDLILHAAGLTIHTLTLDNFKKHGNTITHEYIIPAGDRGRLSKAVSFWYDMSGVPYGWIQILGMGLVKLVAAIGIKIKNPLADSDKSMVCSEFCAHVVQLATDTNIDLDYAEIGGPSWLDRTLRDAGFKRIDY